VPATGLQFVSGGVAWIYRSHNSRDLVEPARIGIEFSVIAASANSDW
jgi:hypothetical protein